jgi:sugar phosphate isomerase/epimerase
VTITSIKGPAIFLAQFAGREPPFNNLADISRWAASLGYEGIQLPTLDPRFIDLAAAAQSKAYCDDLNGVVAEAGIAITELSAHLQGHLVAVHPAYDRLVEIYAPPKVHGNPGARQAHATEQLKLAAKASQNLGLSTVASFSGSLAWPFFYGFPQLPVGLIDEAFAELCARWRPILDYYEECGIDLAFELHAGQDLHDGATFERFLDGVSGHARANILYDPSHFVIQHMDYLGFIDHYHERIRAFHVKDAELRFSARSGVYGGYQKWIDRPGRFRSPGDGQIDFTAVFSKLAQHRFAGWAVLEWECAIKDPLQGAAEGAAFIRSHMIEVARRPFDDLIASPINPAENRSILGLD